MMNLVAMNPLFLWMLPLAGLPILFHLFFRVRKRTRSFPSLMFFHKADPRLSARKKLRELLILLLRILAILFLLLALARPVWLGGGGGGAAAVMLVIDNSGSMSAEDDAGVSRLKLALGGAQALVADLRPADAAGIVLLVDDPLAALPAKVTSDKAVLQAALDRVAPTEAHGLPARALARALALLEGTSTPRREVHVFTDLQQHEWVRAPLAPYEAAAGARLFVHRLAPPATDAANAALVQVELPRRSVLAGRQFTAQATLLNTSAREANVRVDAETEAGALSSHTVTVPAGGRAPLSIPLPAQAPGFHYLKLTLDHDGFSADNRAFLPFTCAPRRDVLMTHTDGGFRTLAAALSPTGDGALSGLLPVAEPLAAWPARLKDSPPALAVLTWSEVAAAADAMRLALRAYVEAGGHLLVVPAPAPTTPTAAGAPDWLGAQPAEMRRDEAGAAITVFEPRGALWDDLRQPDGSVTLGKVKAFHYQPLTPATGTVAQAGLEDGTVLLAEATLGRGRIFTCGFAPDATWTTLPLKGSMLALAQGMALARSDVRTDARALAAGDPPAGAAGATPLGITTLAGGPLDWRGAAADAPAFARTGIYEVRSDGSTALYAVGPGGEEGRFTFIDGRRIPALGALAHDVQDYESAPDMLQRMRRDRRGVDAYLPFLLLALLCVLIEGWLTHPAPRGAPANGAIPFWRRMLARVRADLKQRSVES